MNNIESTLSERGQRYGSSFEIQSATAQGIKHEMQTTPNWRHLSANMRESLDMIATKISRILHGDPHYHDPWHDIVGYAKLVADYLEKEEA